MCEKPQSQQLRFMYQTRKRSQAEYGQLQQ